MTYLMPKLNGIPTSKPFINEVIPWPKIELRITGKMTKMDTLTPVKETLSAKTRTHTWAVIRESMWLDDKMAELRQIGRELHVASI